MLTYEESLRRFNLFGDGRDRAQSLLRGLSCSPKSMGDVDFLAMHLSLIDK